MSELTDKDFQEMHERSTERCISWQDPVNYMYRNGFRAGVRIAQADAESASPRGEALGSAASAIEFAARPITDAAKPIEFDDIRDGDTIRRTVTRWDGTVVVTTGVVVERNSLDSGLALTADGVILANQDSPASSQTLELLGRNEPEAGQYIWTTEFSGEKLSEPILGRVSALGFGNGVDTLDRFPDGSTWASTDEVTAWKPAKVGGLDD